MKFPVKMIDRHLTLNNGVLAVATLITLSWIWGTVQAIEKNFVLAQQKEDLVQQISLHQLENQNLQYQQAYYHSAEFLDLNARERFDKAAPGEKEIILPPNTVASPPAKTTAAAPVTQQGNLQQWLYFLFGQKNRA